MESYRDSYADGFELYVASLAAYSAGRNTGRWITATKDEDELRENIEALLRDCPYSTVDSDWAIHDYRGFYGVGNSLGEHPSLSDLATVVGLIETHGEMAAKLIDYFCGDVAEAIRHLSDKYLGEYPSVSDYAEEFVLSQLPDKSAIPAIVAPYVDYQAMGRDWLLGGEIFTIEVSALDAQGQESSVVHIFTNRPTA
ncbi:putative antirestriction protein [Hyella patelloides LEGE 07179]|uniref:Putative antirestriction protein n=1 Tax=Hyella patelloides LEGE 07179 TaxID=945734 RepID=A0A563W292_9CYAN|nr:antirestriction protein ArdA [Hyella patelloides]VEP17780.1 putative antirestriction protein [Hyella patelloides LEGE 07179]